MRRVNHARIETLTLFHRRYANPNFYILSMLKSYLLSTLLSCMDTTWRYFNADLDVFLGKKGKRMSQNY